MANVVMEMELGRMEVRSEPTDPGEKVRKFPDVPLELILQAKELELLKQEFAKRRKAAGDNYDPVLLAQSKKLCQELNNLWVEIRETQSKAIVARRARERLKQTEAAAKAARRAGHAT